MLLRCPSRGQPDADRAAGFPLWDAEVATADGGGRGSAGGAAVSTPGSAGHGGLVSSRRVVAPPL